jgi:tRNA (mo5U34)-methyltransferase
MNFYHSIKLPDGTVTPGRTKPGRWETDKLPERLDGLDVLDIGAYDGYYSFEAERRGARTVKAIDVWGVTYDWWYGKVILLTKEAFDYCHKALGSKVISQNLSVYDLEDKAAYDLVLFNQVMYHLEHPLLGLLKAAAATKDKLFFESICDFTRNDCSLEYINHTNYCGDMSNFWMPSWRCLERLLIHAKLKLLWHENRTTRVACMLERIK